MKRPGYLNGWKNLQSRQAKILAKRRSLGTFMGFGAFGKGAFTPPPAPGASGIQCQEGEKVEKTTTTEPCCPEFPNLNNPPGVLLPQHCLDCDPGETTTEDEEECVDDPNYREEPEAQQAPQEQAQQAQAQAEPQAAAPQAPAPAPQEDLSKLQAEFAKLQAEDAAANRIVTAPAALAPPSAYTGSPMPIIAPPTKKAPTDEDKISAMVEEFETNKAIDRALAPSASQVALPPIHKPAAAPKNPPTIFDWISETLFGTGGKAFEGLGQFTGSTSNYLKLIIPILVGLSIMFFLRTKYEPAVRKSRKRR